MTSLPKYSSYQGKLPSFLAMYILHSLHQNPKSGYDLLREIREKTQGSWTPSKGTLYPLLHMLEDEQLIAIASVDKRSRTLFQLTPKGMERLTTLKEKGREHQKKMVLYKNLILDIFGTGKCSVKGLLFEIKNALDEIPPGTEVQATKILEQCRDDLKRINVP
jgi:DNA-binding PadR family transcriptional regulator